MIQIQDKQTGKVYSIDSPTHGLPEFVNEFAPEGFAIGAWGKLLFIRHDEYRISIAYRECITPFPIDPKRFIVADSDYIPKVTVREFLEEVGNLRNLSFDEANGRAKVFELALKYFGNLEEGK